MHIVESLVTDGKPSEAMQPRNRALDHPARPTVPTAVLGIPSRDQRPDTAGPQLRAMPLGIVAAVRLHATGSPRRPAGPPRQRGNGVDQRQQPGDIIPIRFAHERDQRDPRRVREDVVLAARLAAIGWVRSSFFPRCIARTEPLSTITRAKSSWPRRRNSVSSTACSRCHTPACCQATSRRQQTVPEPHPISRGSRFHGNPVRSTNRIPVNTARSGIGLRPAYRRLRAGRGGSNGSTCAQSSSSIENVAISDRLPCSRATVPRTTIEYKS